MKQRFSNPWKKRCALFLLPLAAAVCAAAPAPVSGVPYANELSRFDREVHSLVPAIQITPDPVELKAGAAATAYAEARISDEARDRLNAAIASLVQAAGAITVDGLADVQVIQTIRWTVNGMAWGAPLARRVTEVTPVLGRATIQLNRIGNAKVEADIEWRVELRRGVRSSAQGEGPRVWSWMPWSLDLPLSDPRQTVSPMATRIFMVRGATTVAAALPPTKPLPATIKVEGPVRAFAGAEVKLKAVLSILQPGPDVRIEWLAGKNLVTIGDTLSLTPGMPGPRQFTVRAASMKAGTRIVLAEQMYTLDVLPPAGDPKVEVRIAGRAEAKTGEVVVLVASMRGINRAGSYAVPDAHIVWASRGRVMHEGSRLAFSSDEAGTFDVVAMAEQREGGRRVILETARQGVTFKATPPPAPAVVVEKPKPVPPVIVEKPKRIAPEVLPVAPQPEPAAPRIEEVSAQELERQRAEQVAADKAAREAAALEQARIRAEQEAAAKAAREAAEAEQAKIKAEQEAVAKAEAERHAQLKAEQEAAEQAAREAAAKVEAEKQAQLKAEQEAAAKAEAEKQAQLKAQEEAAAKAEAERQAQLKAEQAAAEKAAREAAIAEQAKIKAEQEATAKAEAEKQAQLKAEQEAAEKAAREAAIAEQAKIKAEQEAVAKAEAEKQAQLKAEQEAAAKAEAERQAQLKAEKEAAAKAKAEAERLAQLKAEQEAAEKAARAAAEAEQAKIKAEQEAAAKAEAARAAKLKAEEEVAAKAEAERLAKIKAEEEAAAETQRRAAEQAANQARMTAEKAQAARDEAAVREKAGDFAGAISKLEESVAIAPDAKSSAHIVQLKKQMAAAEKAAADAKKRAEQAKKKLDLAEQQMGKGLLDAAIDMADEALVIDPNLARAKELSDQWKKDRQDILEHTVKARSAIEAWDLETAQAELRLAQGHSPVDTPVLQLQKEVAEMGKKLDASKAAIGEGKALEDQGDLAGAIAKYRAALDMAPNAAVAQRVVVLDKTLAEQQAAEKAAREKAAKVIKLADEARQLERKRDFTGAILKYEAALALAPDDRMATHVQELRAKQAEAEAMEKSARAAADEAARQAQMTEDKAAASKAEGERLEKSGDLDGAIAKFEESNRFVPNAKVAARADELRTRKAAEAAAAAEARAKAAEAAKLLDMADSLVEEGQLDEALAMAQQAATLDPQSKKAAEKNAQWTTDKQAILELIVSARGWMEKFDYDHAFAELQKAQKKNPRYAPVMDLQVDVAALKQKAEKARSIAVQAEALELKGELDAAVAKFEEAQSVVPNSQVAARIKSVKDKQVEAALKQQAADEVEAAEAKALLDKEALSGHIEEAQAAIAGFDLDKAAEALEAARGFDAKYAPLIAADEELAKAKKTVGDSQELIKEGYRLETLGDLQGAITKYEAAYELMPDDVLASHMAEVHSKMVKAEEEKRQAEAAEVAKKAEVVAQADLERTQRQDAQAKLAEAKQLVAAGRLEEAAVMAGEAARLDPVSDEAQLLAVKWSDERRKVMEQVVQARTLMAKYDIKRATIAWQTAKRMHPQYPPVVELGVDLEKMKRNIEQAQTDINDGFKLEQNGDMAGAMTKYENALALVPDAKISAHLASLQAKQEEFDAQNLVNEGYKLEQDGDLAGAVQKYDEALKLSPDARLSARVEELKAKISP